LVRRHKFAFGAAVALLAALRCAAFAQTAQRLDTQGDAQDARTDAMLAMPSLFGGRGRRVQQRSKRAGVA